MRDVFVSILRFTFDSLSLISVFTVEIHILIVVKKLIYLAFRYVLQHHGFPVERLHFGFGGVSPFTDQLTSEQGNAQTVKFVIYGQICYVPLLICLCQEIFGGFSFVVCNTKLTSQGFIMIHAL